MNGNINMGVSTNIYGYYGVKIAWDDELWDIFDSMEMSDRGNDIPEYLADCMGGEYILLGNRLYDSGDYRYYFEEGEQYKEIDVSMFEQMETTYKTKFRELFPQFSHYMGQPFRLIMLFHYH